MSCKAYDLDGAMASFANAVGPATAILPLLNGMRQLDVVADRFGAERVLGGLCVISATLDADGAIVHLNDLHALAAHRGRRFGAHRRGFRCAAQRRDPAWDVGEVGLHRCGGGA